MKFLSYSTNLYRKHISSALSLKVEEYFVSFSRQFLEFFCNCRFWMISKQRPHTLQTAIKDYWWHYLTSGFCVSAITTGRADWSNFFTSVIRRSSGKRNFNRSSSSPSIPSVSVGFPFESGFDCWKEQRVEEIKRRWKWWTPWKSGATQKWHKLILLCYHLTWNVRQ